MYIGEKIVLRLLKKNKGIQDIFDLGFPRDEEILKKYSLPLFCEVMFRNIEINYLRNAFKD